MFEKALEKIFGTKHDREIKKMRPMIAAINDLEPQMQALSNEELAAQTVNFREQLAQGATLDDLLIPAFATVREAGRRVLNMRHFDVQLIGGMVLHRGKIAEMKTGEGKTLVATLPVYLNALAGKGVHVVTVNDYLAQRDSEWMGRIYKALGMSVGVIVHDLDDEERRDAYGCDITYGTNNEFGFDYLRDNMKFRIADCVQREHLLRHRRRSRFHPDRRSAHAADHFRSQRGIDRQVLQDQPHHPAPDPRRSDRGQGARPEVHHRRLHGRRKTPQPWRSPRKASLKVEKLLGLSNMYDAVNMEIEPSRAAGAEGPRAVPARSRLRGEGRRSDHRRRVHRPPDARPPLVATDCTRPSKPRKASRSSARTRRSPPSPSRITSACTKSWPA